jgi:hypothetical protein
VTWSNNNNHFTTILPVSLLLKYFRGVKRQNATLWQVCIVKTEAGFLFHRSSWRKKPAPQGRRLTTK